ncbi:ribosome biogenesis GTPase Der [Candidatus Gracilibacteria bacterium]|nr:ribosome biogenesis GTPase Der [Candidatus Gracilibacteria bacterium]
MKKEYPVIAIIGRPNVGKSTIFNSFLGERKSIISEIAGTTRDSLIEKVEDLGDIDYWLVDTAGLTDFGNNNLENEIQIQAELSMQNADLILWVVDGKEELTQDDYEIAKKLRKSKKPVIFVANKIDDGNPEKTYEFAKLGFGLPELISAKNNFNFWEFTDTLQKKLQELGYKEEDFKKEEADDEVIKVAFIGRPNVGKSSLLNSFLGKKRAVVSEVAGTTRDSIDEPFTDEDGQKYLFIDTAGMRKRGKIEKNFEFWSSVRTNRSIERADVCALLIDALDGVTHQDLVLAGKIVEAGKGLVICVNKFDLIREKTQADEEKETDERELEEVEMWGKDLDKVRQDYLWYLKKKIKFVPWAPVLFFSALTGKSVGYLLESAKGIAKERTKRITTGELNRFVPEAYFAHVIPMQGNKKGKIKFAEQVDTAPPRFLFFVNNIAAFHFSYKRYLENKLREKYGFFGTPIDIEFRDAMKKFRGGKKTKGKRDRDEEHKIS